MQRALQSEMPGKRAVREARWGGRLSGGRGGRTEGDSAGGSREQAIVHVMITSSKGGCGRGDWRCRCVATGQTGLAADRLASPRSGRAAPVLAHLAEVFTRFANVFNFSPNVFTFR